MSGEDQEPRGRWRRHGRRRDVVAAPAVLVVVAVVVVVAKGVVVEVVVVEMVVVVVVVAAAAAAAGRAADAVVAVAAVVPLAADQPAAAVHPAVPPVLDRIVAAAVEPACNLGPALAHLGHQTLDQGALFGRDGVVVERGLEVLMEPLPTLFGRAGADQRRNPNPVVGSMGLD